MKLSEFELAVMQQFWEHGELSAPAVHEHLGQARGVTYSTIKTIIDRLEEKSALSRSGQHGRTILYTATIAEEQLQKPMVRDFLKRVFGGNRRPMFAQLLDDEQLSSQDIDYLESLIRARKQRDRS